MVFSRVSLFLIKKFINKHLIQKNITKLNKDLFIVKFTNFHKQTFKIKNFKYSNEIK